MTENTFGRNIIPENDSERLIALNRYRIMDTASEVSFDHIAKLCTQIFDVPIALISFVDAEKVFYKANVGMANTSVCNRGNCLSALAILSPELTVFEDTLKVPFLATNPSVTETLGIGFYAAAPLQTPDGFLIGSLCLMGYKSRSFSANDREILSGLAATVMNQLELRIDALEGLENQEAIKMLVTGHQEEMQVMNEQLTASTGELKTSQEEMILMVEKLVESENHFRKLVTEAPVAIAIYAGKELIIEQANEKMLGLWNKSESVIGLPLLVARPEMVEHPYMRVLRNVFRSGKVHKGNGVKGPAYKDGQIDEGYYDTIYKPMLDNEGKVNKVMVLVTDVTDKTLAMLHEQELHEEITAVNEELTATNEELHASQQQLTILNRNLAEGEARFRNLIKESPTAIAILRGRELIIDTANDIILNIWGKDETVIGKPLHIALPTFQGQPILNFLDNVFTTGKSHYSNEAKLKFLHGDTEKEVYVNFTYQPIVDSAGETRDLMIVANEVTEQVLARRAVEEVNERLQIALDASKLGSTEVELATGIMKSTDQFKANYGYGKDEDFNYSDLFNTMLPEYREQVKTLVREAMANNSIYKAEYPVKWRDGSIHWISAHGRPRYDANGKADRMVGMTADITESKLFEQRKDDFLSIASHELKTPITSLKAALQLLDRIKEKPNSAMHINLIEQANKSMQKMSVLVDDLLNMNRMNEGQLKLRKTTFVVADMLNECCNHVRIEDKYKLIVDGDMDLKIYADEHRIDQVVVNFVNNAVKYAPDSKEIYLHVEQQGNYAKISVRDNGPGIESDMLPNLFERYYRVSYNSKNYTGLGLGLYICSEIVKRHGGEIGADSEMGNGSTFWFTIPLKEN